MKIVIENYKEGAEKEKIIGAIMQAEVSDIADVVDTVALIIERFPAGRVTIEAEHPRYGREERVFDVWWYTLHGQKKVLENTFLHGRYVNPVCNFYVSKEAQRHAYQVLFPERYMRLEHLKNYRQLKRLRLNVEKDLFVDKVYDTNERFRLALVDLSTKEMYLGTALITPIGIFYVKLRRWKKSEMNVSFTVKKLTNQALPRSRRAGWEDIEPLFVMAALK